MFGKGARLSPLEARKRLLIAESELNRAHLTRDMATLAAGVRQFRDQAGTLGTTVSSSVKVVAGLSALRRGRSAEKGAKRSWLKTIFKSAGLISILWRELRPRERDKD
jgi:hypothetical protein